LLSPTFEAVFLGMQEAHLVRWCWAKQGPEPYEGGSGAERTARDEILTLKENDGSGPRVLTVNTCT
jgi:hypothetical protein